MTRTATTALTLSAEIRQRFDDFSRSQKDVGQYIVDHLDEAAFHTAEELARRASTWSSTGELTVQPDEITFRRLALGAGLR